MQGEKEEEEEEEDGKDEKKDGGNDRLREIDMGIRGKVSDTSMAPIAVEKILYQSGFFPFFFPNF